MKTTLRKIRESDLQQIMDWRMSEHVTKYMNTNPKLTLEGQKEWLAAQDSDDTVKYWLIEVEGKPAGLIYLIKIDWKEKTSSWGYYVGEKSLRSLSLAVSLEMSLYDYVFDALDFREIHNEVFSLNKGVVQLHIACGCCVTQIVPGEVVKEGTAFDITHLSMTQDRWYALRANKKYEKIDFPLFG